MRRASLGDIFEITIENNQKRFFQFICVDETQLNSEVIRVFKGVYSESETINFTKIVNNEIDFYAHTMIKLGVKMNFWKKISNVKPEDNLYMQMFRDSFDYGRLRGAKKVKKSKNWFVWSVNQPFEKVGKLNKEQEKYDIGIVINPESIKIKAETGKFDFSYPGF